MAQDRFWDIGAPRVLEWLIFLAARGRVWYWHGAPPCGTFSRARQPWQRSESVPLGLVESPALQEGNRLLLAYTSVMFAVLVALRRHPGRLRHASFEHPRAAFSWNVPAVAWLAAQPEVTCTVYACCAFGAPWKKETKLMHVAAPWLAA